MKKKLMVAVAALIAVATMFPMTVSASSGGSGPGNWFSEQWNSIWDTTGIQLTRLVGHTEHVVTVLGTVFQIVFGNPYFVLLMMFAIVGAGVKLFGRLRRTVR
ncbi:MAG: hypothetical protein FWE90_08285 [Defluviitaleaceae bacterium]|nr:hypothetical protein [Defluviitaleaceae bacterium]